jgi:hypothetical protein
MMRAIKIIIVNIFLNVFQQINGIKMGKTLGFIILFYPYQGWNQVSFINQSARLPQQNFIGAMAKGVVDMNNDGRDDIIRIYSPLNPSGGVLFIDYQQIDGSFRTDSIRRVSWAVPQSIAVADLDRNGFNDLIMGGEYDGVHLLKQTSNGFTQIDLMEPKIMMQGANLVDINNDGWIDYFACHDLGTNQIWANDKQGNLSPVSDWIDLTTNPSSNNSGNYGSVWSDIDNDGDLDLYITKCSIFAMGYPNDPRRINMLFINDGMGHYSERAADYGLRINGQSWTSDFADIDNDGDMDCFVTNHESNSMLLENDGTGHFSDITSRTGLGPLGKPLQALLRDFDNDGYVDLLVAGEESHLYHNNGNQTFSEVTSAFGGKTLKSFAIGDLNHDGFQDVYASYHDYQPTTVGISADELWMNQPNGNHYLAVTLKGVQSNSNGVGARLTIVANNQKQIREVRSGESYGIMNSLVQYVGLGSSSRIDRLEVVWPSGQHTVLQNLSVDQFLTIEEPSCKTTSCIPLNAFKIR